MEEKLLKLIDVELADYNREQIKCYLKKYKNYKVDNLKKDVTKIKETVSSLDLLTQESAFGNYQAFIDSSKSSRIISSRWTEITHNIETLSEKIPNFTNNCDSFFKLSYDLDSSYECLSNIEGKRDELLEILELPKLMQVSIQKEDYDNALELASYVQKLNAKLQKAVLIESVIKTIESSWYVMISQLLTELRSDDLSLTKSLQLIGFLRRMQAFTIMELKMKFLQERSSWFENVLLSKIPKQDAYQHLIRTIEVTRVNLFNIITQYKALFDDDLTANENEKNSRITINSWVQDKLDNFLRTLEISLLSNIVNISDIVAITNQCMYFGSSFSRIGYDFRAQVGPIFIRAVSKNIKTTISDITTQFESDMEAFTLINRDVKPLGIKSEEEINKNQPPDSILDFYPLAAYTNKLLILFNEIRICVALACGKELISSLNSSLESATKCILNFFKNEQQAFSKKEQENFIRLCTCFCYEFIPYIQQCIYQIFEHQNYSFSNSSSIEVFLTLSKDPMEKLLHLSKVKTSTQCV